MQQYFDCTVVLKGYKANVSMVTFWKAPGCDRKKYNLRREVDVWRGRTRYGDEIAGIKSINSSVVFVSWRTYEAVEGACAIYLMYSHF